MGRLIFFEAHAAPLILLAEPWQSDLVASPFGFPLVLPSRSESTLAELLMSLQTDKGGTPLQGLLVGARTITPEGLSVTAQVITGSRLLTVS